MAAFAPDEGESAATLSEPFGQLPSASHFVIDKQGRFGFVSGPPAWREHRTHYIVAENDQIIPPDLERFVAQRMGAETTSVPGASHAVMVSQPQVVAQAILAAAR